MAMRVILAIVMVGLIGCADATEDAGECEGEHLKLNYRECVGDDQYFEELGGLTAEGEKRDRATISPEESDLYECDAPAAHMCHYDAGEHNDECRWAPRPYQGVSNAKLELKCACSGEESWIEEQDRIRCPE